MLTAASIKKFAIGVLPLLVALVAWHCIVTLNPGSEFYFSSPLKVVQDVWVAISRDSILHDCLVTLVPAIIGLALAIIIGLSIGFGMILSDRLTQVGGPYIVALGSFPIFAVAPMTIVWFGLGISGKVFLAFVSSVFVFSAACYEGGASAPRKLVEYFEDHDFSSSDILWLLRFPSAIDRMVSAFKNAANLALLGVFVGEFVASERGLGRVMLNAGGLYDVKRVLTAALLFSSLAIMLAGVGNLALRYKRGIIRSVSLVSRRQPSK